MNKSVIVIDTPTSCRICPLNYDSYGLSDICSLKDRITDNYNETNAKPLWCPLSPLPERKDLTSYVNGDTSLGNILHYNYAQGFNSCLDEIIRNSSK